MLVLLTTVTFVAALPPILTVAPVENWLPLIEIDVPPVVLPEFGETPLTMGGGIGATYKYPLVFVPLSPPGFVTTTLTEPLACAGAVALIEVLPTTVTELAGVPPKLTVAPEANPVPEIDTIVPLAVGPDAGETALTIGAVLGVVPKNSDMFEAVFDAPGNAATRKPSADNLSRLWN
jgi:hypothetical protein